MVPDLTTTPSPHNQFARTARELPCARGNKPFNQYVITCGACDDIHRAYDIFPCLLQLDSHTVSPDNSIQPSRTTLKKNTKMYNTSTHLAELNAPSIPPAAVAAAAPAPPFLPPPLDTDNVGLRAFPSDPSSLAGPAATLAREEGGEVFTPALTALAVPELGAVEGVGLLAGGERPWVPSSDGVLRMPSDAVLLQGCVATLARACLSCRRHSEKTRLSLRRRAEHGGLLSCDTGQVLESSVTAQRSLNVISSSASAMCGNIGQYLTRHRREDLILGKTNLSVSQTGWDINSYTVRTITDKKKSHIVSTFSANHTVALHNHGVTWPLPVTLTHELTFHTPLLLQIKLVDRDLVDQYRLLDNKNRPSANSPPAPPAPPTPAPPAAPPPAAAPPPPPPAFPTPPVPGVKKARSVSMPPPPPPLL